MSRRLILIVTLIPLMAISCIKREVTYKGKTVVNADGTVVKSGELTIAPFDEKSDHQDSTEAMEYYSSNFVPSVLDQYQVDTVFADGILKISWEGSFDLNQMPLIDYSHKSENGPTARNRVEVTVKNRWIFKDYIYTETYTDSINAEEFYPLIEEKLSRASSDFLGSRGMNGLRDSQGATAILDDLRKKTGVDLIRDFMEDPMSVDTLSDYYDSLFAVAGDSLAGLAGVKLSPDSATALLKSSFDAVWDTLLNEHPEIFGSYGIGGDEHKFVVEVQLPGCIKDSNADSVYQRAAFWKFDNLAFFGKEKRLTASARDWLWVNVAITGVVILVLLAIILWPIRRKRMT